jgi:integrase/recombinase XerD
MKTYQEWIIENGLVPSTMKVYMGVFKEFRFWWKEKTGSERFCPKNVTPIDVQDYKQHLLNRPTRLKPTTINKKIEGIRSYFRYCEDEKILQFNPTLKLKPQKVENRYDSPRWLNRNEKNKIFRFFYDKHLKTKNPWRFLRNKAIVYLMMYAGLRVSEVVSLEIQDIDFTHQIVEINNGKGGKFRRVEIEKELIDSLKEWLRLRGEKEKTRRVFISQKKGPLTSNAVQRMFSKLGYEINIKGLTPHVLRHTFCHDLAEKGFSLSLIAALAGHSDLNTTRIYTVAGKKERRKAIQSLSGEYSM